MHWLEVSVTFPGGKAGETGSELRASESVICINAYNRYNSTIVVIFELLIILSGDYANCNDLTLDRGRLRRSIYNSFCRISSLCWCLFNQIQNKLK